MHYCILNLNILMDFFLRSEEWSELADRQLALLTNQQRQAFCLVEMGVNLHFKNSRERFFVNL